MSIIQTYRKFWVGFDRHAPEHDPTVDKIVSEFLSDFKPQIRIAGGDWQSVDQVNSFTSESKVHLKDEFAMNRAILRQWKITHYLEGNHEERLRRIGLMDERLRTLADLRENLELDKQKIEFLPYHPVQGVLQIGCLKVLHGFYTNEYVASKTARTYGTCIFGHCHRFQTFWPKAAFDNHVGFAIGMLGSLNQSWAAERAPMGWGQGFAFGYIHKDGYFDLYPVRIVGDQVTINNRTYRK